MLFAEVLPEFDPISLNINGVLPELGAQARVLILSAAFLLLAALTALTYLIGHNGSWVRFLVMLSLRLAALLVVAVLLLRPSMVWYDEIVEPSKLIFVVDASQSMAINDGFNNQSRWKDALRLLRSQRVQSAIKDLQLEKRMEIAYYRAAESITEFEATGQPDGKKTLMARWLRQLFERHSRERNLRGLLLLSDGADNGPRLATIEAARQWRGLGCPIYVLGLGSPTTTRNRNDIFFDSSYIKISPKRVFVKGKFKVSALAHAPGNAGAKVNVALYLDGKKKTEAETLLLRTRDNPIELECDAPETPGDYKVTVKIEPLPGETSTLNNEISTFVTVTKEGVSVLWVEGKKRLESTWVIRHVLRHDPRIRVYYTERLREIDPANNADGDWFDFKRKHYDVIVIGDISGERFCGNNPTILDDLNKMVKENGAGLMMIGGHESFGNTNWQNYPKFSEMLPVHLRTAVGEIKTPVRVKPTGDGFDHYVMRLVDDAGNNRQAWEDPKLFKPLQGMSRIGKVKDREVTLATTDAGEPIMAFRNFGKGRVMVFGGDTTHIAWCSNPAAFSAYKRFWNRLIRWLARQEDVNSDVWVKLSARRFPAGAGQRAGITVGLRNEKPELKRKTVRFKAFVVRPDQKKIEVSLSPATKTEDRRQRGFYLGINQDGEHTVVVEAADENGKSISETAKVRFLAYSEDLENLNAAADHDHLAQIAQAASDQDRARQFRRAGEQELLDILASLGKKASPSIRPRVKSIPDWRLEPDQERMRNQSALEKIKRQLEAMWWSGTLLCFGLFCSCICIEWFLRRRWNMA